MIWNHFIWNFDEIFETLYFTVLFALNANLMYVYMFFKKKIYDYAIQFKIRTSSWDFLWHLIFGQVQPACDFPVFAISQICWVLRIWLSHSGLITGWRMFIARMFYIKLLGTVYSFEIGLHSKHSQHSLFCISSMVTIHKLWIPPDWFLGRWFSIGSNEWTPSKHRLLIKLDSVFANINE